MQFYRGGYFKCTCDRRLALGDYGFPRLCNLCASAKNAEEGVDALALGFNLQELERNSANAELAQRCTEGKLKVSALRRNLCLESNGAKQFDFNSVYCLKVEFQVPLLSS